MIILGTNSVKGGFNVANSLRFNDGSSDFLSKTFGSAGNQQKMTISFWIKRSDLSGTKEVISQGSGSACHMNFQSSGTLEMNLRNSVDGGSNVFLITDRLFRDVSAWYHIVLALDTTQGTASNRAKLYVNGVQETSFGTENYPSQNGNLFFNEDSAMQIGEDTGGANFNYDGYMAEFVFINAEQLAPTSFGEFDEDSGIWKPKNVSGLTFGTNGFYLEFKESGTGTNASGMGADTSGNTNHFAVNNLTAVDQSIDTCTNNFATMNPLDNIGDTTFSEGNNLLLWTATNKTNKSTIGVTTGKWYAECKAIDVNSGTSGTLIGVGTEANLASTYLSATTSGWGYRCQTGNIQNGAGNEAYGDTWAEDDIIGVALDMDNGAVYMSKNGTFQDSGDPTSGASKTNAANNQASYASAISGTVFFACSSYDTDSLVWNFGSPSFAISSGNTDGNGYGNFEYAVPSGYFALNTKNLAEYG